MRKRFRTGGQALVRAINLSIVLRYIQTGSSLSRAGLASLSGLNKTTVSSLVAELMERGLVHEVGLNSSGTGRPAKLLALDPDAGCSVGVALGVDFISVVLVDFCGKVIWRRFEPAAPSAGRDETISRSLAIVDEGLSVGYSQGGRILGLGLAVPGMVRPEEGVLIFSPNLSWRKVPLGKIFRNRTGLRVWVDNDANAVAQAEHLFGVARDTQNFVSVLTGVGVGAGLFLNGELYRGASGYAGEVGHTNLLVESNLPPCRCGHRGCWETYVNQYALLERMRSRLEVGRPSLVRALMRERDEQLSVQIIFEAARQGDVESKDALAETGRFLGLGIANMVSIFNPEIVVLGGSFSEASEFLLPSIMKAIHETTMPEITVEVKVLVSAFGPDASVMGAAGLVIEAILSDPSRVNRLPQPV